MRHNTLIIIYLRGLQNFIKMNKDLIEHLKGDQIFYFHTAYFSVACPNPNGILLCCGYPRANPTKTSPGCGVCPNPKETTPCCGICPNPTETPPCCGLCPNPRGDPLFPRFHARSGDPKL